MKKTTFIAAIMLLVSTASIHAQTDTVPSPNPTPAPETTVETTKEATVSSARAADRWNNHDTARYRLLPMPEPLTQEKIFPALGKFTVTDKDGNSSDVVITLDETNKGIVWVDGLPQGRFKAMMRQIPATYKIPAQTLADDKKMPEGVLIYDKENNVLDVCVGCTYNMDDPGSAFATTTEPATEEEVTTTKVKKSTAKTKVKNKVTPVKTWKYSGNKVIETTASVAPMQ